MLQGTWQGERRHQSGHESNHEDPNDSVVPTGHPSWLPAWLGLGGRRHFACCLGLQRSSDSSWASGGRRRESRGTASAAWKGPAPTHPPAALKMRPVPNAPLLSFPLATRPACAHHRARLAAGIFKRTKALSLGKETIKPNSSVQSRSSNKKVNGCLLSSTFEPFTRKRQPFCERESHRIWVGAAPGPRPAWGGSSF